MVSPLSFINGARDVQFTERSSGWEVNDMLQDGLCSAQECYLSCGKLSLSWNSVSAVSWWLGLAVNHAMLLSEACLD